MDTLAKLLEKSGTPVYNYKLGDTSQGNIKYITSTGIILLKETQLSASAHEIFDMLHIKSHTESNKSAEFNSKLHHLTYEKDSTPWKTHLDDYADWSVSLLIIGLTDATIKDLIAYDGSGSFHVSKVISNNCESQADWDNLIFRVYGTVKQTQVQLEAIAKGMSHLTAGKASGKLDDLTYEQLNGLVPGYKIGACVVTASLKTWHHWIIKHYCVDGNGYLMRNLASQLVDYFHEKYPDSPDSIFVSHVEYSTLANKTV